MDDTRVAVPGWLRVVEGIALSKVLLALPGFVVGFATMPAFTAANFLAHVVLFAGAGVVLRVLGSDDARAQALGIFFIVVATAWADRLLGALAAVSPALAPLCSLLLTLQVIAFSPYLFWMFVREFPRRLSFYPSRLVAFAMRAALIVGCILFIANASRFVWTSGTIADISSWFDRRRLDRLFWPLNFGLSFPAIAYAAWQGRRAAPDEQRRVKIMLFGLILGNVPEIVLTLVAVFVPELARYAGTPGGRIVLGTVVSLPELTIPFIVAYAVLVHRALDLRIIVRRVLQYALARTSLAAIAAVPIVALFAILFAHRDESLTHVSSGVTGMLLLAAIVAGFGAVSLRPRLLLALDRQFFREQYDARLILGALVENTRSLHDENDIMTVVPIEIDRALHVEKASLFLLDQQSEQFVVPDHTMRPLPTISRIVNMLSEQSEGMFDVDWTRSQSDVAAVPEDEQQWLAEIQARLLVAVRDHAGTVIGAIALGEKRSGLPFSHEDRNLLRTIADAVGLAVEHHTVAARATVASYEADTAASECRSCGLIARDTETRCKRCSGGLVASQVPLLLAGKFRPVERVGRGGMGVVYRAVDVTLAREVALKTLPKMSAALAARMRREARVMAAVSHPNLAAIYSAETWRGSPALVVEFLHAGTLADKLARDGALPSTYALGVACKLAEALACLHEAGLLHRDIKPSNIGFATDGSPKLLDFGLARVLEAGRTNTRVFAAANVELDDADNPRLTATGDLVGTLPYLPPESMDGTPPSTAFDLWALSMVLYEAIAGRHPLLPASSQTLQHRIWKADIPDIREYAPGAQEHVANFFSDCLNVSPSRRPQTARDWQYSADSLRQLSAIAR